jgi:hypothetical protein
MLSEYTVSVVVAVRLQVLTVMPQVSTCSVIVVVVDAKIEVVTCWNAVSSVIVLVVPQVSEKYVCPQTSVV